MQFLDCRHTTDSKNTFQDSNLFTKGSQMQSQWKRPNSPVDMTLVSPIINNLKEVLKDAGLDDVISFPVVHCPQAFGVVLKGRGKIGNNGEIINGWKIVYSGDTRPCPELIKAAQGATVLIHEVK